MNNTASPLPHNITPGAVCARCAKNPVALTVPAANGSHDAVCALCAYTEVPRQAYRGEDSRTLVDSTRFVLQGRHGLADEKGRAIGGVASIVRPEDHGYDRSVYGEKYRGKWMLDVHATRDGKTFGASNRSIFVDSLDEAKERGVKMLREQRNRYAKKLGVRL